MIGNFLNKLFYFLYEDILRNKKSLIAIVLISIILIVLGLNTTLTFNNSSLFFEVLVLPFKLISTLIKSIALSSKIGNVIGWILFLLITLLPFLFYLFKVNIKGSKFENILNFLFYGFLSFLIGRTLYLFINPSLIKNPLENNDLINPAPTNTITTDMQEFIYNYQKIIQIGFVFLISCIILTYIFYHLYQVIKQNKMHLFNASNILLTIQKISYVVLYFMGVYFYPLTMKADFKGLTNHYLITLTVLKYIYLYIVLVLILLILRRIHDLLIYFRNEVLFDEQNVKNLKKTSELFTLNLLVALIYQFLYNGTQILFSSKFQNLQVNFQLPLTQIVLALVFYLLSLIMSQSYKIYKEHSLTI